MTITTPIKLSEVPFDKIKIGGRCVSAIGNMGTIESFDPTKNGRGWGLIKILWDNGNISYNYIFLDGVPWFDSITYLMPEN